MLGKKAELTEQNDLKLKRDREQMYINVDALNTEETADTMELERDLEGILEFLKENDKDDLTEKAAWLDCSKTGGPNGTSPAPSSLPSSWNDEIPPGHPRIQLFPSTIVHFGKRTNDFFIQTSTTFFPLQ